MRLTEDDGMVIKAVIAQAPGLLMIASSFNHAIAQHERYAAQLAFGIAYPLESHALISASSA